MPFAKVSALIPTYNSALYIEDAVESALSQSYPLHEIIVVDDGSTDETDKVLRRFGSRIKYIRQANAGPPAARNTGLQHVTGDFVALLDSDDLWMFNKTEREMQWLERHPGCGFVYTDMKTFDESGVIEESVKISRNLVLPSGYIFPQLFEETLFQTSALLVRKSCIEAVGGFDTSLRMGDDYEFFLRIARHYEAGYVDEPLVLYRQHPHQGTRTWGKQLQDGAPWEFLVLKKIVDRHPEMIKELGKERVDNRLAKPYFGLAYACMKGKDHSNARKLLKEALHYQPRNLGYWRYYLMTLFTPELLAVIRNWSDSLQSSRRAPDGSVSTRFV